MTNKLNRSGELDQDRNHESYKRTWDEIIDKKFTQTIFHSYPALVCKELVNGQRMWKPYNGEPYDQDKYELVKDMWDHEHCSICGFKILDNHTYWFNERRVRLLCDECHDYYESHNT